MPQPINLPDKWSPDLGIDINTYNRLKSMQNTYNLKIDNDFNIGLNNIKTNGFGEQTSSIDDLNRDYFNLRDDNSPLGYKASDANQNPTEENVDNSALWNKMGQIQSGVTKMLPNWYQVQHSDTDPQTLDAVYGDSTQDPIARLVTGHSTQMNNSLYNIQAGIRDYSDVKNNINLYNAYNPNRRQNVDYKYGWSNVADNLTASATGAGYGMQYGGPWGALIGGIIGGAANIPSQIGGKKRANILNKANETANITEQQNFQNRQMSNDLLMQRNGLYHLSANGGYLPTTNGVTEFNVGSTHEQNPYGGIQQGIASDGLPNMVEEGEVKWNDYIFSARNKPSKQLLKKVNLPEKYNGKTFAEIANKLQEESEARPNDPISKSTLEDMMSRLTNAQEEYNYLKEQRQTINEFNSLSPDEQQGLMQYAMQQPEQEQPFDYSLGYADGGKIFIKPSKRGTFTAAATKHGMGVQEFARKVLANPDNYSPAMRKKANFARNAAHWGADGMNLEEPPYYTSYPYPLWLVDATISKDEPTKSDYIRPWTDRYTAHEILKYGDMLNWYQRHWNIPSYDEALALNPGMSPYEYLQAMRQRTLTSTDAETEARLRAAYSPGALSRKPYYFDVPVKDENEIESDNITPSEMFASQDDLTEYYRKRFTGFLRSKNSKITDSQIKHKKFTNAEAREFLNYLRRNKKDARDLALADMWESSLDFSNNGLTETQDYHDKASRERHDNPASFDYKIGIEHSPFWEGIPERDKQQVKKNSVNPEEPKETKTPVNTPTPSTIDDNLLRYAPLLSSIAAFATPTDYTYSNALNRLAGEYKPIAAPALGGYRRYNPYDVNLANNESMAQLASIQRANRENVNRASQAAANIGLFNAYAKDNAARNLALQQANEANRSSTDTYNLGIDQFNRTLAQAYDQLNAGINDKRVNMLTKAAEAADNATTLTSTNRSQSLTNFLNNLGALGKENLQWSMVNQAIKDGAIKGNAPTINLTFGQ